MRAVLCFILLSLAGCGGNPATLPPSALATAPEAWHEPAERLPDIPKCSKFETVQKALACRTNYDEPVRTKYVELAHRHAALSAYVRAINRSQNTVQVASSR